LDAPAAMLDKCMQTTLIKTNGSFINNDENLNVQIKEINEGI